VTPPDLSRRLAAAPGFRWMPGMRAIVRGCEDLRVAELVERYPEYAAEYESFRPSMEVLCEFLDAPSLAVGLFEALEAASQRETKSEELRVRDEAAPC
jgi:hypothetical protein